MWLFFFVRNRKIHQCYTTKNTTLNTAYCMYEILKCHSDSFALCYPADKVILVIKKVRKTSDLIVISNDVD